MALDETVLRAMFTSSRTTNQASPPTAFGEARDAFRMVLDNVETALNVRRLRGALSSLASARRVAPELIARGLPQALAADIRDAIKLHDFADIAKGGRPGKAAVRAMIDALEQVAVALNALTVTSAAPPYDCLSLTVVSTQPARQANTPS